jgi:hypothetical protein
MERKILLAFALLLLPPATRAAGDAPLDRATLRGLKAVGVVIDVIDPELEKAGVTRAAVMSHLLARLQHDRVTVDPGAAEFVGLRMTAVRSGRGPFAVSIMVGVYQPVILSRNHDVHTSTQTWEVETILMADLKSLPQACSESTDDLADRFAAAFYAANPE